MEKENEDDILVKQQYLREEILQKNYNDEELSILLLVRKEKMLLTYHYGHWKKLQKVVGEFQNKFDLNFNKENIISNEYYQ